MKKLFQPTTKMMIVIPLVALVLTLSAFTNASPGTIHATPHPSSYLASKVDIRPDCNGSVTASPRLQNVIVYYTAVLHVNWYCEGGFHVVVNVAWGDGGTSSYTCWANCTSGEQDMDWTYTRAGNYYPSITMGGFASGNTSAQFVVVA